MQVTGILKRGLSYGRYKLSFAFDQDDKLLLPCHQRNQNNCLMLPLFRALHKHIVEADEGSAVDDSSVLSLPRVFRK